MSAPGPAASVPFDARPLVEPIDRAAVRDFTKRLRAEGRVPGLFSGLSGVSIMLLAIAGVVFFGFMSIFLGVVSSLLASASQSFTFVAIAPFVLIGVVVAIVVIAAVRMHRAGSATWFRLDRFAQANGMTFRPALKNPPLPGMIFSVGSDRTAANLLRGDEPRFVEFANYRYSTGSGKNQTTHKWGYVAVHLDVPLPHIVLDAIGNNGLFGASNLPAAFDRDQRLSLEGDFDRYFSLYCPAGYERDALYLFTPDIMARFIDNAAALDVEIVDDWLFLYARRDFSTTDPATWAWLFSVVSALLGKLAQWERWRDDRLMTDPDRLSDDRLAADPARVGAFASAPHAVTDAAAAASVPFTSPSQLLTPPPPGVATPGRRLTRRIPWATIIVAGVFVLIWLFMQTGLFGVIAGFLSR
jgi:hypothetical protein